MLFHFPSDPFFRDVSGLRKLEGCSPLTRLGGGGQAFQAWLHLQVLSGNRRLRCSQHQAVEEEGEAGVGAAS